MKPQNIFIVRHGESEGNANKDIYLSKPDYSLLLTEKGQTQALEAGKILRNIIGNESISVYYSPFFRSRQTTDLLLKSFSHSQYHLDDIREEPRLREQEWTNRIQGVLDGAEEERDLYGHFYYRFHNGESCADVYDRVSDFFNSLHRDFLKPTQPPNVIISSHGMTNRLFIMRWFHLTTEEFEMLSNPHNCEIWQMKLYGTKYKMVTPIRKYEYPKHNNQYPFVVEESVTQQASTLRTLY